MTDLPVISVTELVTAFKEVVETALPPCCVEAEISNCRSSPAGHIYLTLKDDNAEISAVIWRSSAARLRFQPKHGLKVLAVGQLQVYLQRGTCQFIVSRLMPQGMGELELALRQLRERLEREGLFDESRKRPIPRFPRRIALVTSPSGAAVRDMIQVISRRWPSARMIVVPVRVQGDGAAGEIASALRQVHLIPDVDVVITGRGGGSLEDLWCFNEEVVARAIADCQVPVISAVGHEVDVSIADLVADRRALTPSEAGELVVPALADVITAVDQNVERMRQTLSVRIRHLRTQLEAMESRAVFQRPQTIVDDRRLTVDELCERLGVAATRRVEQGRQALGTISAALDALSPLKVLSRGYSLTESHDGQLIRSVDQVTSGMRLSHRLADGVVKSTVDGVERGRPESSF
ncbi:MAG: exodeoxyribonuclease VII large subunit [Planctomycetaceae bacterium]|nr:exodeoxyribonuclease VII large subunit [Planctomycetaceae bacterium]